jgi:hypothetical protein
MLQAGRYFPLNTGHSRRTFRILCCLENRNAPRRRGAATNGLEVDLQFEKASGIREH